MTFYLPSFSDPTETRRVETFRYETQIGDKDILESRVPFVDGTLGRHSNPLPVDEIRESTELKLVRERPEGRDYR